MLVFLIPEWLGQLCGNIVRQTLAHGHSPLKCFHGFMLLSLKRTKIQQCSQCINRDVHNRRIRLSIHKSFLQGTQIHSSHFSNDNPDKIITHNKDIAPSRKPSHGYMLFRLKSVKTQQYNCCINSVVHNGRIRRTFHSQGSLLGHTNSK